MTEERRLSLQIGLLLLLALPFAWLLMLSVMLATGAERVSVRATPSVIRQNGEVSITCTVPRHVDNRKLTIGIPYHRATSYDMAGEQAPIMFSFRVHEVPCLPVTAATCLLETNKSHVLASTPLVVAGC